MPILRCRGYFPPAHLEPMGFKNTHTCLKKTAAGQVANPNDDKSTQINDIMEPAERKFKCLGRHAPEVRQEEMTASSMNVVLLALLAKGFTALGRRTK